MGEEVIRRLVDEMKRETRRAEREVPPQLIDAANASMFAVYESLKDLLRKMEDVEGIRLSDGDRGGAALAVAMVSAMLLHDILGAYDGGLDIKDAVNLALFLSLRDSALLRLALAAETSLELAEERGKKGGKKE
ncbi:MAG: hypothetical protein QXZ31_05350 [Thermofilaceae archaeon]